MTVMHVLLSKKKKKKEKKTLWLEFHVDYPKGELICTINGPKISEQCPLYFPTLHTHSTIYHFKK